MDRVLSKDIEPEADQFLQALYEVSLIPAFKRRLRGCFYDPSLIDGEFHELFVEPLLASDERIRGQIHYLRGIDWKIVDGMRAEHSQITIPTLLIWGEDDPIFPIEEAKAMACQFPDCRGFVTIPKARTFVHEERPAEVARVTLDFLGRPSH